MVMVLAIYLANTNFVMANLKPFMLEMEKKDFWAVKSFVRQKMVCGKSSLTRILALMCMSYEKTKRCY